MKLTSRTFKVEIRDTCKVCGEPITEPRFRSYCSDTCRNLRNNIKQGENNKRHTEYNRYRKDREAEVPSINKIRCRICGRWYVQIGSHVIARHGYERAKDYRREFGYDVKRGQLPDWFREQKRAQNTKEAKENLKIGKKFWFKPGDRQAGVYERSEQTMDRLKTLYKFNKHKK